MTISLESIVVELILKGGDAKGKAIEAIREAKVGNFIVAEKKLEEANESLVKAHEFQTKLLQEEASRDSATEISLLLIHGQDHLMNAITTKDLANEIVDLCKLIYNNK
ncbi:MAG: PTS lactose/cellobiose transporter subunit IIA [Eubacteriales bacterium]